MIECIKLCGKGLPPGCFINKTTFIYFQQGSYAKTLNRLTKSGYKDRVQVCENHELFEFGYINNMTAICQ